MLCDVVRRRRRRRRRRRWAHAPVIHAASHFDHKKRVAWVPISMHTCGSFFYNYGAPLGGPSGRWSSANNRAIALAYYGSCSLLVIAPGKALVSDDMGTRWSYAYCAGLWIEQKQITVFTFSLPTAVT